MTVLKSSCERVFFFTMNREKREVKKKMKLVLANGVDAKRGVEKQKNFSTPTQWE